MINYSLYPQSRQVLKDAKNKHAQSLRSAGLNPNKTMNTPAIQRMLIEKMRIKTW
jgi:hypothetical protein